VNSVDKITKRNRGIGGSHSNLAGWIIGHASVAFLIVYPVIGVAFVIASMLTLAHADIVKATPVAMTMPTMAMPSMLPAMPPRCTTPKTMNKWYGEVAQQNLRAHRSPADCKNQLISLGATAHVAGISCSR
jgi:hypothetical protein